MSELGDLLVLLHGARGRTAVVRATVRTWQDQRGIHEAMQQAQRRGYAIAFGSDGEGEPLESVVRVWLAPPDLVREEREGAFGEGFGVRRGAVWWRYDAERGATSNEDEPEVGTGIGEELSRLIDPAPLIGLLDFEAIAPGRHAGRDVLRVRAVPRSGAEAEDFALMPFGALGGDELLLDVDAERGALLRVEVRGQGRSLAVTEVTEIAFDEVFADDVFVFTPPPGEEIRSVTDRSSVHRGLTIEQAVARAEFTVWIPARLPAGWETEIFFVAENDRPLLAPHVHLHYRAEDGMHAVSVAESPAAHPGEHADYEHARPNAWEDVERDGRRMQIREPAESWQPAQARLELEGTRILIHSSDLAAGALADLAAGLVPAPAQPPSLGR
jgi:outer membrane lipoprotein-sorting protein